MYDKEIVTLERNKRFSKSILWAMQRDYFEREGIDAWSSQVPFFVTSNPFMANCYASTVIAFIRDTIAKNPDAIKEPFYMMELGTGSGQVSYYILKRLQELQKSLHLEDVQLRYIMTDFTESNLKYWQDQPQLKPFIEQGILDFAIYNMEEECEITLVNSGVTLKQGMLKNPLTVFANYIFDTVSHDVFSVEDNELKEGLVSLITINENMKDGRVLDMDQVMTEFEDGPIEGDYYDDPDFNAVLNRYKTLLKSSHFLFPVGGLRSIRMLRKLSDDKLLLISSDKGYASLNELDYLDYPRLAFHGSFSMMVNFHAIHEYFKQIGGGGLLQTPRSGINTCVFYVGMDEEDMPNMTHEIQTRIEGFSAADYFVLHRNISETFEECKLNTLAAHMVMTCYDPYMFHRLHGRICGLLEGGDKDDINYLASLMPKIADNFYQMPKAHDAMFDIAIFFHTLKRYDDACEYYQRSQAIFGQQFGLVYNIGLCQYNMGLIEESYENFKAAKALDADAKEVSEWVDFVAKELDKKKEKIDS